MIIGIIQALMRIFLTVGVPCLLIFFLGYFLYWLFFTSSPKKEEEEEKNKVLTPLDTLKGFIGKEQDELTKIIASISKIGDDLAKGHTKHPVACGVLDQFKVRIEDYIKIATSDAEKFRGAERYLHMIDVEKLNKEIEDLIGKIEGRVKPSKDIFFKRTLKQKQDTLKNLDTIQENKAINLLKLKVIEATLLSLQASIVSLETGGISIEQTEEEMQTSISALSQSLDQFEQEEKKVEEEVLEELLKKEV